MLFSSDPTDRFYEQLMMTVPNHRPRRHGLYIYGCTDKVLMEKERIRNGEVTCQEVLTETMKAICDLPPKQRLDQYPKGNEESSMIFRNEKHRTIFEDAIRKREKKNYALMAALYLLTADFRLWNAAKHHVEKNAIDFGSMRLNGIHENGYVLFGGAKDLYAGTKNLSIADLADTRLIPPKIFILLCNAMAIRRFGLVTLKDRERTEKNDSDNRKTE